MNPVTDFVKQNIESIPFKALQPDEMEASTEEKVQCMTRVLEEDPALFLSRWGRHLPVTVLHHFQPLRASNYEVDFHMRQLLERNNPSARTIRNRRYQYLKRHLRETAYFTDESMQKHDPVLYEQYIGRYQSEEEKNMPFGNDVSLVQRVLKNIDQHYAQEQVKKQKIIEEEQFEEEEDSDDEDDDSNSDDRRPDTENVAMSDDQIADLLPNQRDQEGVKDENEEALRESRRLELIRLLEERFLAGKDSDFDYSKIDTNETYDDLDQQDRDAQDSYFDEESPDEEMISKSSEYTGELDY
ncbi:coiled-coil domain-containing protein-domain-containing protein [Dichotomocladium elegans]|nr:coiled-coil domain-containing protein-domain-containing protein [Dichotomocladium elegans]